jgi:hypothetical protein
MRTFVIKNHNSCSEHVLDDLPRDPWHVGWLTCKDVPIVVYEVGKFTFLFVG